MIYNFIVNFMNEQINSIDNAEKEADLVKIAGT